MPGRPATVASYAAGASLAAVALIYVFGPTFTLDNDGGGSSRKKTIVGLRNQANDCFINSVLQVLAGLPDLRIYLIRETHRRRIEDPAVYAYLVQPEESDRPIPEWKLQGLQEGLVTYGLKEMLDALNERPIYKKSISPFPLVRVLETAFRQRISRQQQDAQEFLQIVAERLKDEYHAGRRARMYARKHGLRVGAPSPTEENAVNGLHENGSNRVTPSEIPLNGVETPDTDTSTEVDVTAPDLRQNNEKLVGRLDLDESFPMEGKYESQLQCLTCRYKPKPKEETFCTLTLAVPQVSSTSLNNCFDGIFKTEHIDDFKCANCRLVQAKAHLEHEVSKSTSDTFKEQAQDSIEKLAHAIETDPEEPPKGVDLGAEKYAPKRKIAKTTRITVFPMILAIHLSRSIYGVGQMTQKNSAKVAFPEMLPLGGLADQRRYKLLGVVTHRGGHNSGHYEAFRRQNVPRPPFANINTFQASEIYSKTPTPISTPDLMAKRMASPAVSTPDLLSPSSGKNSPNSSLESMPIPPRSVPPASGDVPAINGKSRDRDGETSSLRSVAASTKSALSRMNPSKSKEDITYLPQQPAAKQIKKRKPPPEKWWRVSDEKVRESKTSEVLGMQKEVYLLFYELDSDA
jgi:ubiquitin carboxyl-terminal hydrolase 16